MAELDVLSKLVGLPLDDAKSESECLQMVLLGACVTILEESQEVSFKVDDAKAEKWASDLDDIRDKLVCDPKRSERLAGRLNFAVCLASNRIGRAYLKPFYALAFAPWVDNAASPWLQRSAGFFASCLRKSVTTKFAGHKERVHINCWTDAAGAGKKVAAFIHSPLIGWQWTLWEPPDELLYNVLLDRDDNQIGFQELAGVLVAMETFAEILQGCLITFWQDNQGVLGSILKGGGKAAEANAMIGRFWIRASELGIACRIGRVESKANLADGPTRDCQEWVQSLGAEFVSPIVPSYVSDPWRHAEIPWN